MTTITAADRFTSTLGIARPPAYVAVHLCLRWTP
jgi:hypothetical protein